MVTNKLPLGPSTSVEHVEDVVTQLGETQTTWATPTVFQNGRQSS